MVIFAQNPRFLLKMSIFAQNVDFDLFYGFCFCAKNANLAFFTRKSCFLRYL